MNVISFKSRPEYWIKEYQGLKCNTLRRIEDDDLRLNEIEKWLDGDINILYVQIQNTSTQEVFLRRVTDITPFEGLHIISWDKQHIMRGDAM